MPDSRACYNFRILHLQADNVLVSEHYQVKIADFGTAARLRSEGGISQRDVLQGALERGWDGTGRDRMGASGGKPPPPWVSMCVCRGEGRGGSVCFHRLYRFPSGRWAVLV